MLKQSELARLGLCAAARLRHARAAQATLEADRTDARICASIETRREHIWRLHGLRLSVADLCAYAPHEMVMLDFANGEASPQ